VTNIQLQFEAESGVFNSTSQFLLLPVNASWAPPSRFNGVLTNYSVKLQGSLGNDVIIFVGPDNMARASVSIRPFEFYNVLVTAETGGGTSLAVSNSVRSPEAGKGWSNEGGKALVIEILLFTFLVQGCLMQWNLREKHCVPIDYK